MTSVFAATDVMAHNFNFGSDFLTQHHPPHATALVGHSLLHEVAREGDILTAEAMIEGGENVNLADDQGRRPLHEAALFGRKEMVEYLVSAGALIDAPIHPFGHTPLWLAIERGHVDTARTLLRRGAHLGVQDALSGQGLLHMAAAKGNTRLCGLLIRAGADVFMEDRKGRTVRDYAAQYNHAELEAVLAKVMHHHACYGAA